VVGRAGRPVCFAAVGHLENCTDLVSEGKAGLYRVVEYGTNEVDRRRGKAGDVGE